MNNDFQGARAIRGAVPTETVEKIFAAHRKTEQARGPVIPPEADARATGSTCGLQLQRGTRAARLKLPGIQGRDVLGGPQTRQLASDMAVDGLLITVPALTDADSRSALRESQHLVKSYEESGLFPTANRVLLAHGTPGRDELTKAAEVMRAKLVIVSSPEDYRVAVQQMIDVALTAGAAAPKR